MKPNDISKVLNIAKNAREKGLRFIPCFTGDAGLGKSQICQEWAKTNGYEFIDLRPAVFEAPDMIGLPETVNGRTVHFLPDFWPEQMANSKGLLLIEEVNRANTSVTNALMQLLTDRKIHKYTLPEGWIIASCINEGTGYSSYDMDSALRNRFTMCEVKYDPVGFRAYMELADFHPNVRNFVNSGTWQFKPAGEVDPTNGSYISPRTLHALSNAEHSGMQENGLLTELAHSFLGKAVGADYIKFVTDRSPVTLADLRNNPKESMKKLKKYSSKEEYQADLLGITNDQLVDEIKNNPTQGQSKEHRDLVAEVALVIPEDLALSLVEKFTKADPDPNYKVSVFFNAYPKVQKRLVSALKGMERVKSTEAK